MNPRDHAEDVILAKAPEDGLYAIAYAILEFDRTINKNLGPLFDALRTDHPLQGETFSRLADSLDNIAEAIRQATP